MKFNLAIIYIYIILSFLLIIYIPLGSYDSIGPQWFSISLLNFIFLILINKKSFFKYVKSLLNILFIRLYILFIIITIISFFFASNISIFFHDLGRILSSFLFLLSFSFCLNSIGIKRSFHLISIAACSLLFYEIFLSLKPYIIYFYSNGFDFWRDLKFVPSDLRGIAGNKNLTAVLYMLKLPFLFFLMHQNSLYKKIISSILFLFSISILLILEARATYISFILMAIIYAAYLIFFNRKSIFNIFFLAIPILLSLVFINYLQDSIETASSVSSNLSSIQLNNDSSSNRFELWSNVITHLKDHPFGIGLGNWKLEATQYWGQMGSAYQVPYHAHNDFLEISIETGIYNGAIYFSLFCIVLYFCFINIKRSSTIYFLIVFSGITIYLVDAMLNFPLERAYVQLLLHVYFSIYLVLFLNNHSHE